MRWLLGLPRIIQLPCLHWWAPGPMMNSARNTPITNGSLGARIPLPWKDITLFYLGRGPSWLSEGTVSKQSPIPLGNINSHVNGPGFAYPYFRLHGPSYTCILSEPDLSRINLRAWILQEISTSYDQQNPYELQCFELSNPPKLSNPLIAVNHAILTKKRRR